MSVIRVSSSLLFSPSSEAEQLTTRIVRSQNRFLLHAVTWGATSGALILLNLMIDGLQTPWSLIVLSCWGAVVAGHWLFAHFVVGPGLAQQHRQLVAEWRQRTSRSESTGVAEIHDLRDKLLAGAELAREALRPTSPEATADVSRGEAKALDLVAWLDEAEPILSRGAEIRSLRAEVAKRLSNPLPDADREPLDRLLGITVDELVNSVPFPLFLGKARAFRYGLVSSVWIDFIGCFAIEPTVSAAEPYTLGIDYAYMSRSE